jgi:DNA invertase Pin-like site-specific DNA recombinase
VFVENQNIDRFTLQILSVVYENEVTVTRNRIKQTMDKLRRENKWEFTKIGTKNFSAKGRIEGAKATKEVYGIKNKNIVLSIENIILKTKSINYSAISNELNKLKTRTINGMDFKPQQVKRLINRYSLMKLLPELTN